MNNHSVAAKLQNFRKSPYPHINKTEIQSDFKETQFHTKTPDQPKTPTPSLMNSRRSIRPANLPPKKFFWQITK